MPQEYQSIINGNYLTAALVIFSILSVVLLSWYLIYLNYSKERSRTTIIGGAIATAITLGIEIQLVLFNLSIPIGF